MRSTFALLGAFLLAQCTLSAASLTLKATADTTLIEVAPENNMGANLFFNAGTTLNAKRNRGLLRFDLTEIPKGSRVTSACLVLEVVGIPTDEPASANFRLHRMLKDWGEGDKVSVLGPGRGAPATIGEATWNQPFAYTTNVWAQPGGTGGIDFATDYSAEQFIYALNSEQYTFGPSTQMATDVQGWVNNPAGNFGWMLKVEDEATHTTARRFAASQDEDFGPLLVVEFDPPPLLSLVRTGNEMHLSFQTRPDEGYLVQKSSIIQATASWEVVTNIVSGAARPIVITNAMDEGTRFFRLKIAE